MSRHAGVLKQDGVGSAAQEHERDGGRRWQQGYLYAKPFTGMVPSEVSTGSFPQGVQMAEVTLGSWMAGADSQSTES